MAFPMHIVAAAGFVEDGHGNILLVKTRDAGWMCPGGQVEVGENLLDGLVREIKEESGIDAAVGHLINVYSNTGTTRWYDGVTEVPTRVGFDFVCHPIGGELEVSEETTDSRWVAKDRALDFITPADVRFRYQVYLEFNGSVNYAEFQTQPKFVIKYRTRMSK